MATFYTCNARRSQWFLVFLVCCDLGSERADALSKIELSASGGIVNAASHSSFLDVVTTRHTSGALANATTSCGKSPCSAFSEQPCCSSRGECGISDAHCKCSGCIDLRTVAGDVAMKNWHAEVWGNVCKDNTLITTHQEHSVLRVRDACPFCHLGVFAIPTSDFENTEVSSMNLPDSKWGNCLMEWPEGQDGTLLAPNTLWRIDVLSTGSRKVPLVRWPCSVHGSPLLTGATVTTRAETARWARLMHSAQPDGYTVKNALDIGGDRGSDALRTSLFTSGRTLAFEKNLENYHVLNFFTELNPSLGVEAKHAAVALGRGHLENLKAHFGTAAIDLYPFLQRNYGEEFMENIGFVNLAIDAYETSMLQALSPLLQRSLAAVHVKWHEVWRLQCGDNSTFLGGSHELLSAINEMGYVAHDPDSGEQVTLGSKCDEFKAGPGFLLLLPEIVIENLGKLSTRWSRQDSDARLYLQPMISRSEAQVFPT